MPLEPLFWYGLILKMTMTAAIVVAASVAVERSGPFIGALIATLPTAAGAAQGSLQKRSESSPYHPEGEGHAR